MKSLDRLKEAVQETRMVFGDEEVMSISRRHGVGNGFDGTLAAIGIAISSYLSGIPNGRTVIMVYAGTVIGLGVSGVWSVWEIERAEKQAEVQRLETAMLHKLDGTEVQERKRAGRRVNAFMSGLGPVVGVLLPASPYAFEGVLFTMLEATVVSVVIAIAVLFSFGIYMSTISKQDWVRAGVRMALAGVLVTFLNLLLPSAPA